MTTISTLGLQQTLLSGFQNAQSSAQERQIQLSTGQRADTYGEIGIRTPQLLSAESVVTRASAFENAASAATSRLQIQEGALNSLATVAADLRQAFIAVLANGSGEVLQPQAETAAVQTLSALNTQSGGVFLFDGRDGTNAPVSASTLADLQASSDAASVFGGGERARLTVEQGLTVDGGPLASEIGSDFIGVLKDFADAPATIGAFNGPITDAQRRFLVEAVGRLETVSNALNTELGLNGVAQAETQAASLRQSSARDLAELTVSDIEDADLAEVIARLNQDQLAIQASAQALAAATQLSLLNFL